MRWRGRHRWPAAAGKLDLIVMSAAFTVFGFSLIFRVTAGAARAWL